MEAVLGRAAETHEVDEVYVVVGPDTYRTLVEECGWSREQYTVWLADALARLLRIEEDSVTTLEKSHQSGLDGPADTRMMRIVHTALRRDLARTQVALAELAAEPDDARREAVAAHLQWMMTWLHHHHEGEDQGLYPYVRARNAAAGALLDEMDADHQRILPAMAEVERAATAYAASAGARSDAASSRGRPARTACCPTSSARRRR